MKKFVTLDAAAAAAAAAVDGVYTYDPEWLEGKSAEREEAPAELQADRALAMQAMATLRAAGTNKYEDEVLVLAAAFLLKAEDGSAVSEANHRRWYALTWRRDLSDEAWAVIHAVNALFIWV